MLTSKGYPYPTLDDGPDGADVPYWMQAQGVWLDNNVPVYSQGALADRPVSSPASHGIVGRRYLAQPENVEYIDTGMGWVSTGSVSSVDAAANVGSLRTLGTGALQAAAGNDARLSD